MSENLPNYLIVGAAKSGTTSLFDQLCAHPEVFAPYIKEPGFFIEKNQYSSIENWEDYKSIFKKSGNYKAAGEASVTYLYDEKSPGLIKDKLGKEVKILIILRNPIDMAHSLWLHRKRDLKEDMEFFEAIKEISKQDYLEKRKSESIEYDWDYIGRAQYYTQVRRYMENFENVMVLIFEDYIQRTDDRFSEVCRFLGIDDSRKVELEARNTAYKPRISWIQKFLTYPMPVKDVLKKIFPHSLLVRLKYRMEEMNKTDSEKVRLSSGERRLLLPYFKEDVTKLSQLLERDLSEFWTDFK